MHGIFQSLQNFFTGGPYAVARDGSFIVCGCDGTIKIVDSSNAAIKSTITIEGDSERVTALALTPCNSFILSYSHNRQIRLWLGGTRECIRSWKGPRGPDIVMAVNTTGGLLATGANKRVQVWANSAGIRINNLKGHKGVITSIMFHPISRRELIFSGSDDTTVKVWCFGENTCVATLEKHQSTVTSIAISQDRWTLMTAGRDNVVNIWDLNDYTLKNTLVLDEALVAVCTFTATSPFSKCLSSFAEKHGKKFSSSSVQFLTVGEHGIVRIWNSEGNRAEILFEQKSSYLDGGEVKTGFNSAMVADREGFLYAVADQQFLVYGLDENGNDGLNLTMRKRLIGYNKEITDVIM